MYWKYALGFFIASLVQAGIIYGSETFAISNLGATLTLGQLIIHVLAGQAAGFLLMVIMQSIRGIAEFNFWLLGALYGSLVYAILIPINVTQGTINSPWEQGLLTLTPSLLAFIVYGIISTYTIKTVESSKIKS